MQYNPCFHAFVLGVVCVWFWALEVGLNKRADTQEIQELMDRRAPVHLIGIGGVGMAGLALLLRSHGLPVTGCDQRESSYTDMLTAAGIPVMIGHDRAHVDGLPAWVVRSTAIAIEMDEVAAACEAGLPVVQRGLVLAAIVGLTPHAIAVAGTHGKTTTATLLATLLMDQAPGWCIGGRSAAYSMPAGPGDGGPLVVEADESDGTLAAYAPQLALVTNVDFDHMEHFASEKEFYACFERFMVQAEQVLFCVDDVNASRLALACGQRAIGYGFGQEAAIRGIWHADDRLLVVRTPEHFLQIPVPASLPGVHNVSNLLGAVAACLLLGVVPDGIPAAVERVGLPARRYELIGDVNGVRVVSDYAHHPTEIAALVRMARAEHAGRIVAVFQPHRYSRTVALRDTFPPAFAGVDTLVLTPVYAASEAKVPGGTVSDLYAAFRRIGGAPVPLLANSLQQAGAYLAASLQPGDLLLVIGAGDVDGVAHAVVQDLRGMSHAGACLPQRAGASRICYDAPIGQATTYQLGGRVDCLVDAANEADLAAVLRFCVAKALPVHIMGAGSNVLVSDLGVRGVVIRLTGACFQAIQRDGDLVRVGAGVRIDALQEWLTEQALQGLTFLEKVPGGVGGILRMNGGAYGHEIRERILWIRGLNRNGEGSILQANELDWGYRGCESLRTFVVTEACFAMEPGYRSEMQAERAVIREKRAWMEGLRCSGSVFRNPPGTYAGRLIEEAGLKGLQVGGATVSGRHGNFIVAEAEATASDVLAVIRLVEDGVERLHGVPLVREVVCLE